MKRLLVILFVCSLAAGANAQSRNADVPYITAMLEQADGSRVSVKYRAIHWGPITMSAIETMPNVRDYYNTTINNKMALLNTNVKLRIGADQIDPGVYYLGFLFNQDGSWQFVVSNDQTEVMNIQLPVRKEAQTVPFLSFVLTPGITDRDFIFTGLYGNLSTAMRWTITGVPSTTASSANTGLQPNPAMLLPLPSIGGVAAPPNVSSASPPAGRTMGNRMIPGTNARSSSMNKKPGSPRRKAGSGSFRHMRSKQTKEKDS